VGTQHDVSENASVAGWAAVAVLGVLSVLGVLWARRHAFDPQSPPTPAQMAWRMSPFAGLCLGFAIYSAITGSWPAAVLGAVGVVLFIVSWMRYRLRQP